METKIAREVAARVWCDPEMSNVVMDAGLAEIIALLVQRAAQQAHEAGAAEGWCPIHDEPLDEHGVCPAKM